MRLPKQFELNIIGLLLVSMASNAFANQCYHLFRTPHYRAKMSPTQIRDHQSLVEQNLLFSDSLRDTQSQLRFSAIAEHFSRKSKKQGLDRAEPWNYGGDLKLDAKTSYFDGVFALTKILSLYDIKDPRAVLALSRWTNSAGRAQFVFETLYDLKAPRALVELHRQNVFMNQVAKLPFGEANFLTLSFEKEDTSPGIAKWLDRSKKPESQSEEEFAMQPVGWNSEAPFFLGARDVGQEHFRQSNGRIVGRLGYELRSRAYEISSSVLFAQIRKVSQLLRNTHSIHAHLSFELPSEIRFGELIPWLKAKNDELTLSGMEEGLHPNSLTYLFPSISSTRLVHGVNAESGASTWLDTTYTGERLLSLGRNSVRAFGNEFKFFSLGFRQGIYGDALNARFTRVGLELRDVTRDQEKLKKRVDSLKEEISGQVWQIGNLNDRPLVTNPKITAEILAPHFGSSEIAVRAANLLPTLTIPLIEFETGRYYKTASKTWYQANPSEVARIQQARSEFYKSLGKIAEEMKSGQHADTDIIAGLQWVLSEWAARAQVSHLYSSK